MNRFQTTDLAAMELLSLREQAPVDSTEEDWKRLLETPPDMLYPWLSRVRLLMDEPRRLGKTVSCAFQFLSPLETGYASNDIVRGLRWHDADSAESEDALVMLHGAYADTFGTEKKLGRPTMNAGAHIYFVSLPYHMKRQPPGSAFSGQYLLSPDLPRLVDGILQGVADVGTLVASLRHAGYQRITLFGVSLGGLVASLTVQHIKLDGAYLLMPALDPYATVYDPKVPSQLEDAQVRRALDAVTPTRPGDQLLRADDMKLISGEYDMMCPSGQVEAYGARWPGVEAQSYPSGHLTMSRHFGEIAESLAQFVARRRDGSNIQNV